MKKANKPTAIGSDTTAAASVLLAASGQPNAASSVPGQPNVIEVLASVLARRLLKEEAAEQDQVTMAKKAREQGAHAMAMQRKREMAAQAQCPHMKPWGGSAVTGQRDHRHNFQFICQFCSRRWLNDELPAHLHIAADRIGGPNT